MSTSTAAKSGETAADGKPNIVKINPTGGTPAATPPDTLFFPFWSAFRDEIDHAFNRVARSFATVPALWRSPEIEPLRHFDSAFGFAMPAVDVVENADSYQISAELPGLQESDIDVSVANNVLTLKGCKAEEREEKKGDVHLSERRYGTFQRSFHIPRDADQNKISATFEHGVLTLVLPKTGAAAEDAKKIPINK